MGDSDFCCCFCSGGSGSGIITLAIVIWLGLWTLKPTLTIEHFDVSSIKSATTNVTHTNETTASTISFDLKLKNRNFNKRVYYDAINITFYHKSEGRAVPVGDIAFPPFTQGLLKSTHLKDNLKPRESVNASSGVFRIDLATAVRYTKMYFWKTGRRALELTADFEVNGEGSLVNDDGVKLRSSGGGGKQRPGYLAPLFVALAASWVLLVHRSWMV